MAADASACTLNEFLHGDVDNATFHHADHVRVAFELLRDHNFPDAAQAYCASLKAIATRAGNSGAYHETITLAFLSLVAERLTLKKYPNFAAFTRQNADLLDKTILTRWYDPERLNSPLARATFVLPDSRAMRR